VDLFAAALLGVVQGLTEFLPVSSSGHLILARAFFGWDAGRYGLPFDVACHVGTLLAVVAFFRRDVAEMIAAAFRALAFRTGKPEQLVRLIVIGTLPVPAVVLLFGDQLESLRSPEVVAGALAIGGLGLVIAERFGSKLRSEETITYLEALVIGCAQAAALIPGVSRSGATLTVALLMGLRREGAARFVFLLSMPAILAAAGKETVDVMETGVSELPIAMLVVGLLVSAVVGYLTIKFFVKYLAHHSLNVFALYRFVLAAITVVWLLN
jgi:undecaprenyl-diphosphatase